MKRRTQISLVLLAALLTASSLLSCGNSAEEVPVAEVSSAEDAAVSEIEETEAETSVVDLLPNADYEGYTFNILSTDPGTLWGWRVSISAEEETGEPLNDAVFRRNTAIEERYNITIANSAELDNTATSANAKQLSLAGDDLYSIISYGVKWQLSDAVNGCFVNLNSVDTLDMENAWWNSEAGKLLTLHGKLFVGFSEMNTFNNEALACVYMNNDIIANNALESPYDLVREGRWTLDVMYDMSVAAARDLDGSGNMSEGDIIGYAVGIGSINSLLTAAAQPHVIIGEDGSYILNHGTESSIAAAEKIAKLTNDVNSGVYLNDQSWGTASFQSGNGLFSEGVIASLGTMREAEFSLAPVPSPKFDEQQESYYSMMSNQSFAIVIPKPNKELEKTGVICEALGAYSLETLRETYYESMLKEKMARDTDTVEMLDAIIDSSAIDVGVMNEVSWGTLISGYIGSIRASGADELSSYAAKNQKMAEKLLEKISNTYAELD